MTIKQFIRRGVKGALRRLGITAFEQAETFKKPLSRYSELVSLFEKIVAETHCRPQYVWGTLWGVDLAAALGIPRVSVFEFGVAGGAGLLELERVAEAVERHYGIGIDVYGFDTGKGLPKPQDYRDLPNLWQEGNFAMDRVALEKKLTRAKLVLGLIEETIRPFLSSHFSPVAFAAFDLDLYGGTAAALKLFEAAHGRLLPRVQCYFDDMLAYTYSEFTGPRLAIREFNDAHPMRKISPVFGLRHYMPRRWEGKWHDKMYLAHFFDHPRYGDPDKLLQRDTL